MTSTIGTAIRVVVVDDSPVLRELVRHALRRAGGFEIVGEAGDGVAGIDLVETTRPDLLLLDLAMPRMDGLEVIGAVTSGSPSTRIVVLSGFDADQMEDDALRRGVSAYLVKGASPDTIVRTLRHVAGAEVTPHVAMPVAPVDNASGGRRAPPTWVPAPPVSALIAVLPACPEGLLVVRAADGVVVYVNDALAAGLGHTADALVGRSLRTIVARDGEARRGTLESIQATLDHPGAVWRGELVARRRDGTTLWTDTSLAAIEDSELGPLWVGTVIDATARRRAHEQLVGERTELARSNRELEELAYAASHDLSAPLGVINGFADMLAEDYSDQLDENGALYLRRIREGAATMRRLIEDLLEYARVDSRGRPLVRVTLDGPLQVALSALEDRIASSDAVIEVGPLPDVDGDPVQLAQLFQNLVANALKFVPRGTAPHIVIGSRRVAGEWFVSVADNGIGVPAEARQRIFRMFQRLSADDEYEGTGIGLALCARIATRHGGRVWVEPGAAGGSVFITTFPAV